MLIINADDLGRNLTATDNALTCYGEKLITSASVMVFMADSQRAAELARATGLPTGLHLNLTLAFSDRKVLDNIREQHLAIVKYFNSGKWTQIIYNPFLKNKLAFLFMAQYDEYCRLFAKEPDQIDGHHHIHLCLNIVLGRIIPLGQRVRKNFSFEPGEKGFINRLYRRLVDSWLIRRYACTTSFYSLEASYDPQRIQKIVSIARSSNVELMVHPERPETFSYLMSTDYRRLLTGVPKGTYRLLPRRPGY